MHFFPFIEGCFNGILRVFAPPVFSLRMSSAFSELHNGTSTIFCPLTFSIVSFKDSAFVKFLLRRDSASLNTSALFISSKYENISLEYYNMW